jgi:hypothetical protein
MKSELLPIVHKKTLDKKFIVLIIATTLAGLANGVSFAQMARMMSDITYAPWLLYATALPYTVLYFIMVYLLTPASEIRSCRLFWYYFVLGVFGVGLAGVTSQFGDGYVSPTLQALVQSLQIPFTAIGIKLFMTDRFGMASAAEPISCLMWCGVGLVMTGIFLATVVPKLLSTGWEDDGTTIAGFFGFVYGMIGAAIVDVVQRSYFKIHSGDVWLQLLWSNLITIPIFLLSPLLTMSDSFGGLTWDQMIARQGDGFQCFAQVEPLPYACQIGALPWTIIFIFAYGSYYYMQSILVKEYGAIFQSVILGLVVVGQTLIQTLSVFGDQELSVYNWIALALCILGIVLYAFGRDQSGKGKNFQPCCEAYFKRKQDWDSVQEV